MSRSQRSVLGEAASTIRFGTMLARIHPVALPRVTIDLDTLFD